MTATLPRTMASPNIDAAYYSYDDLNLPPWETERLAQVPYFDGSAAGLSEAEKDALPALWAAQTNTARAARPRLNAQTLNLKRRNSLHDLASPESGVSGFSGNSWGVQTPLTAPPPPPAAHYSPVYIPPAPKTEPTLPSFVMSSPRQSDASKNGSSSTTSTESTPACQHCQHCQHEIPAFPGTMTHQGDDEEMRRRRRAAPRAQSTKSTRMSRLRIVLKGLFKGDAVDETQLERIEDRHWAEEY